MDSTNSKNGERKRPSFKNSDSCTKIQTNEKIAHTGFSQVLRGSIPVRHERLLWGNLAQSRAIVSLLWIHPKLIQNNETSRKPHPYWDRVSGNTYWDSVSVSYWDSVSLRSWYITLSQKKKTLHEHTFTTFGLLNIRSLVESAMGGVGVQRLPPADIYIDKQGLKKICGSWPLWGDCPPKAVLQWFPYLMAALP